MSMTPNQLAKWNDRSRKPFDLFNTVEEELSVTNEFWRSRTPLERLEYLEFMRCVIFGEEAVNAKMIRCYGWRKMGEEADPKNIVYF
jgi:single-stranded DNA-binding protein